MKNLYNKVAKELNIPPEVVAKAYKMYWEFIYNHISNLPLKEDISEEEFNKLKVNINLPELGKIYTTYEKISRAKKEYKK